MTMEELTDGVLVVTLDCPDTPVNKVSSGLLEEIAGVLDQHLVQARALVILSAKQDNFIVGADLAELEGMSDPAQVTAYIQKAHAILARLEGLSIPVVCGIHGSCLGGGLEMALVADHRIASDSPDTVLGLPEVQLGLLPAAGGTQRLPRLIGLRQALPLMLTAKNLRVKRARRLGLIDEITNPHGLRQAAISRAARLAQTGAKRAKVRRALGDRLLEATSWGRNLVFKQARKQVLRQTHGLYPAPLEIIDSVDFGCRHGVGQGMAQDVERFTRLAMSPQSAALRKLFFAMTELKKKPRASQSRPVQKLGVLGAGLMGGGIAAVSAPLCETVLLKDLDLKAVAKGMRGIAQGLQRQARSGAITSFEQARQYGKIVPSVDYQGFKKTDLVIEAVFEDLSLKRRVLAEVEQATDQDTIFATNTSALPLGEITAGCARPQNVVGMHYFSPVHRMPLLEIITTNDTAQWVADTALDFGLKQGKTCIVVKDGPGFYTTRILAPLLNEAVLLVEEGVGINEIDRAMLRFGYPVGPLTLLDEVGIDVGAHVAKILGGMFAQRNGSPSSPSLSLLFDQGFLGKKNQKGLYRYSAPKRNGMRQGNPEIYKLLGVSPGKALAEEIIQDRISLMMVNEAVHCLQEGIIASARDGDVGAILGLGFPPFRGGPFRHIDALGAGEVLGRLEELAATYGPRFRPAELLKEMAVTNRRFHE